MTNLKIYKNYLPCWHWNMHVSDIYSSGDLFRAATSNVWIRLPRIRGRLVCNAQGTYFDKLMDNLQVIWVSFFVYGIHCAFKCYKTIFDDIPN